MVFINYVGFDWTGQIIGSAYGKIFTNALIQGNLFSPILYLFLLLTFIKIANDIIVEKRYNNALKDILFSSIFFIMVGMTTTGTFYNINLVQGLGLSTPNSSAADTSNISNEANSNNNPNYSGQGAIQIITLNNIPIGYDLLSLSDQLAYEIAQITLIPVNSSSPSNSSSSPNTPNSNQVATLEAVKMFTDPKSLDLLALQDYETATANSSGCRAQAYSAIQNDPPPLTERLAVFYNCIKDNQAFSNEFGEQLDKLGNSIGNEQGSLTPLSSLLGGQAEADAYGKYKCSDVFNALAQSIVCRSQAACVGGDQSQVSKCLQFFQDQATAVRDSYNAPAGDGSVDKNLADDYVFLVNKVPGRKSILDYTQSDTPKVNRLINSFYDGFIKEIAKYFQLRSFFEDMMFKINGIMMVVAFALYPFIVTLAFLPTFGYNFKLLFEYVFGYFLLKLWIPILLLTYQVLVGYDYSVIDKYISSALNYINPYNFAYADPNTYYVVKQIWQHDSTATNLILTGLPFAIVSLLGAGPLLRITNSVVRATETGLVESMELFQQAWGLLKSLMRNVGNLRNLLGDLGGGGGGGGGGGEEKTEPGPGPGGSGGGGGPYDDPCAEKNPCDEPPGDSGALGGSNAGGIPEEEEAAKPTSIIPMTPSSGGQVIKANNVAKSQVDGLSSDTPPQQPPQIPPENMINTIPQSAAQPLQSAPEPSTSGGSTLSTMESEVGNIVKDVEPDISKIEQEGGSIMQGVFKDMSSIGTSDLGALAPEAEEIAPEILDDSTGAVGAILTFLSGSTLAAADVDNPANANSQYSISGLSANVPSGSTGGSAGASVPSGSTGGSAGASVPSGSTGGSAGASVPSGSTGGSAGGSGNLLDSNNSSNNSSNYTSIFNSSNSSSSNSLNNSSSSNDLSSSSGSSGGTSDSLGGSGSSGGTSDSLGGSGSSGGTSDSLGGSGSSGGTSDSLGGSDGSSSSISGDENTENFGPTIQDGFESQEYITKNDNGLSEMPIDDNQQQANSEMHQNTTSNNNYINQNTQTTPNDINNNKVNNTDKHDSSNIKENTNNKQTENSDVFIPLNDEFQKKLNDDLFKNN